MAYVQAHLEGWLIGVAPGLTIFLAGREQGRGQVSTLVLDVVPIRGMGVVVVKSLLMMPYAISVMVGEGTVALPILESATIPYHLPSGVEQVSICLFNSCIHCLYLLMFVLFF